MRWEVEDAVGAMTRQQIIDRVFELKATMKKRRLEQLAALGPRPSFGDFRAWWNWGVERNRIADCGFSPEADEWKALIESCPHEFNARVGAHGGILHCVICQEEFLVT